ncbi:polycystin-2-like [Glandiceps talaboti]
MFAVKTHGKRYFNNFWNVYDSIQIIFGVLLVVMYIMRYVVTEWFIVDLSDKAKKQFVSFQYIAWLNELYTLFLGIVVFLAIIKFLRLLRFNKRMGMLAATIRYAAKELIPFFVILSLFLVTFTASGYLFFGTKFRSFQSFIDSLETLILTFIGKFYFSGLNETVIGSVYCAVFSIICFFILLNMLVSIINDAFIEVRKDASKQGNDYEIVAFMMQRLQQYQRKTVKKLKKKLRLNCGKPGGKQVNESKLAIQKLDLVMKKLDKMDLCTERNSNYKDEHIDIENQVYIPYHKLQ